MRAIIRPILAAVLLTALSASLVCAAGPLRVEVLNSRRELAGRISGAGAWMAFSVDETDKSLNGDTDMDDTVLHLFNVRSVATVNTGVAVDSTLVDSDEDWPVDFSGGDQIAIQVSEADNGGRDLNGNGRADDNVLHLFSGASRQLTNLGLIAGQPTFAGGRLYFVQQEADAGKDLNGDGDRMDPALGAYHLATKQVESLGMEAEAGFQIVGDRIATLTNESAQGGRDLNGDKDAQDLVVQLYDLKKKEWSSTGLEASFGMELTSKLVAIGVDEQKQGGQDLNGDGDAKDTVCEVWDLAAGKAINLAQDCGGDLYAEGSLVGFVTAEKAQGNKDLNGDKDTEDQVAQSYTLGAPKAINLGRDASGGIAVTAGRVAFACSEADFGNKDLNQDRDTNDYVLLVYNPTTHQVTNSLYAVDGDLNGRDGYLAWATLEADQGERDLNRDTDTDDSVLFVMDVAANSIAPTANCSSDYVCVTSQGVAFATPEEDQGRRDLNGDRDTEDTILQVARYVK